MGFGAMFLGFMFLYDFQLGLRAPGSEEAYALLDIFPDFIGWILLFFGLRTLAKKEVSFTFLKYASLFFLALSLFSFTKETLLFSSFYVSGKSGLTQVFAGECLDVCEHFLTLAFIFLLFRKTASLCREKGEDKVAFQHDLTCRVSVIEGVLYAVALLARLLPQSEKGKAAASVISRLDFLFWVLLIWFGAIALFRAMRRVTRCDDA